MCDPRCEWSDARDYDFVELHQFHSPITVHGFLGQLLGESRALGTALDENYVKCIVDAWRGIIKSRGMVSVVRRVAVTWAQDPGIRCYFHVPELDIGLM